MKPTDPRVQMPHSAKIGEVIQIKTKIRHPMETGWREVSNGHKIGRNRLTKFTCLFEGDEVAQADWASGISQDPYFLFYARVTKAGTFTFRWEGDHDQLYEVTRDIQIGSANT